MDQDLSGGKEFILVVRGTSLDHSPILIEANLDTYSGCHAIYFGNFAPSQSHILSADVFVITDATRLQGPGSRIIPDSVEPVILGLGNGLRGEPVVVPKLVSPLGNSDLAVYYGLYTLPGSHVVQVGTAGMGSSNGYILYNLLFDEVLRFEEPRTTLQFVLSVTYDLPASYASDLECEFAPLRSP